MGLEDMSHVETHVMRYMPYRSTGPKGLHGISPTGSQGTKVNQGIYHVVGLISPTGSLM